jgi:putative oxidoreductase
MKTSRVISIFLARLFLSLVFITSAIAKIFNWHDTEKELIDAMCDWQSHALFSETLQDLLTVLVPWSALLLLAGVLFELVGSLMILFGYRERLGAALLIMFMIPATLLFYSFWLSNGSVHDLQVQMFLKNLAIIGGLIFVAVHGAQAKENAISMVGLS